MTLWAFPPVDSNSSTLAITANILVVVNILSYIFLSLNSDSKIIYSKQFERIQLLDTRSCRRCNSKEQMDV
jgi:hypothetical protein